MLTKLLAQEIVDRTIEIIGYNVNVMDKDGIIMGSGDESRLYELHAGAVEAIAKGAEIEVSDEDVIRLKGTKTGINLPITFNGEIVGVIGVTGPLEDIRGYGKLVKMAAELSLSQAFLTAELQWDTRHKEELVRQVVEGKVDNWNLFLTRAESLGLVIEFPCEVLYIEAPHSLNRSKEEQQKEALKELLKAHGEPIQIQKDQYILFLLEGRRINKEKLIQIVQRYELEIGCGMMIDTIQELPTSYEQAFDSLQVGKLRDSNTRIHRYEDLLLDVWLYRISRLSEAEHLKKVILPLKKDDLSIQLMQTLQKYIEENGEIQQVASSLFVHRNTIQYRLQRIADITKKDPRNLQSLLELYISLKIDQFESNST
ncbi:CdaR family transcriptional regulator [Alkalihalophilus sp. As8PL]|uniref:CdaR family transcriptional regulator n=1 Tax=Alkalihalophilus sp. As8PL TaxID=3237103 RepID=A0AB39BXU4_9BACI